VNAAAVTRWLTTSRRYDQSFGRTAVASATGFARHRLVHYKDIGLNDPPLRQRMTVRIAIQAPSCRLSRSGS
jgi:hypothetical protein